MARNQIYCLLFFILAMLFCAARFVPEWSDGQIQLFGIWIADPAQNVFTLSYAVILLFGGYYSENTAQWTLTILGALLFANGAGHFLSGEMYSRILMGKLGPQLVAHKSSLVDALIMGSYGLAMFLIGIRSHLKMRWLFSRQNVPIDSNKKAS